MEKQCKACGETKSIDLFYQNKTSKTGFAKSCKECAKKRTRNRKLRSTGTTCLVCGELFFCASKKSPWCSRDCGLRETGGSYYIEYTSKGTLKRFDVSGNVISKDCTRCSKERQREDFFKSSKSTDGLSSDCRDCKVKRSKDYRDKNPDKMQYFRSRWESKNYQKRRADIAKWKRDNRHKSRLSRSLRRALERGLPSDLTDTEIMRMIDESPFNKGCRRDVHIDHFIPIKTGHGGTVIENLITLSAELNHSKSSSNPFTWSENKLFGVELEMFNSQVTELATLNGLTASEFESFVRWCFNNPRTPEQVQDDNRKYGYKKPSIDIWRECAEEAS